MRLATPEHKTRLVARGGRQSVVYPLVGAFLASGAPLGLLMLRRLMVRRGTSMWRDVRDDLPTYAYVTIATTAVFVALGHTIGGHVDNLAELSTTDGLTGLLNRRTFDVRLEQEIQRSRRSGAPISLLLIDVDGLKTLNDEHGHAAGDRALRSVAAAVRQEMRSIDTGARLGGDEFGLLAVGATARAADAVAERVRKALGAGRAAALERPLTVSIGVVTFDPSRDASVDGPRLMQAVDRALYGAKRAGRNRTVCGSL
jgi:diguanylate cyclase (GGDEF)-like protein